MPVDKIGGQPEPYNNDIPSTETCGEYYLCEESTKRLEREMGRDIEGDDWDAVMDWIADHGFRVCGREYKVG